MNKKRLLYALIVALLALLLFLIISILIAKYNGKPVAVPDIPRQPQIMGDGPNLTYVVMGDSTSVGQGTTYKNSYAYQSAQHLSQKYKVKLINVGISGAITKEVSQQQLDKAASYKPDVVLLAVGANDARRFVKSNSIRQPAQHIIDALKQSNCDVRIVVTGSPAMDSVARFPWLIKKIMRGQTNRVNSVFDSLIKSNDLTWAPVAQKTRSAFLADPTLFAQDKFHPNARGYALWTPVINDGLDQSLQKPSPKNCHS